MKIELKKIDMENFKKVAKLSIDFAHLTKIYGQNATGKTTVEDAFMWCLFDKNSAGETKFQVRPLDSSGNQIDHVEIMVVVTLEVDGKKIVLSKTQKQNWVKKRGSQTETLQGNNNFFEIDGIPKKEKDYREFVFGLANEELFKLLTNPQAFVNRKWKEQREELMKLTPGVDAGMVIATNPEVLSELNLALSLHSPEDLQAKSRKALSEYKKQQLEIPARIDEVKKSMKDIDVAELELQKNMLQEQIAEIEQSEDDVSKQYEQHQKETDDLMDLKFRLSDMERSANEKTIKERNRLDDLLTQKQYEIDRCNSQMDILKKRISDAQGTISAYEKKRQKLYEEWGKVKADTYFDIMEFDEDSTICPTCGQVYPSDRIADMRADFERAKASRKQKWEEEHEAHLERISSDGNQCKNLITQLEGKIKIAQSEFSDLEKKVLLYENEKAEMESELAKLPERVDISNDLEYQKLSKKIEEREKMLAQENSGAEMRQQLRVKKMGLKDELAVVEKKIASADNSAAEERIEVLRAEMNDISQKVADEEKMIYLLEEFTKAKMTLVSRMVNEKFGIVNWKLFDKQINGAVVECCECMVNGVPYSTLNTGHRIVAGLDIIRTLSEMHGVIAPIFIDNAEAVNDYNIPEMESQLILLSVSDDKELRVESEEE
ncbi:MAG: AAA family ATPase [Lachnospiraceae bacterium]|nr:AAA family ATPase [Lachnospiraceae bacterium]